MTQKGRKRKSDIAGTSKQRKLEIYFPTRDEKEQVLKDAERKRMSSSRYVLTCIQNKQVGQVAGPAPKEVIDARTEVANLKAQIEALTKENEKLLNLTGRYSLELEVLRTKETPVPERPSKEEVFDIDPGLIEALRSKKEMTGFELIEAAKIDAKDKDALRQFWKALDFLTSMDQVEQTADGWRWVG